MKAHLRYLLLAGFPLLVFASQVVWVTYSPVASDVAKDLGVSKKAVGLLVMLFPIVYIIMAYPAGRLLDTRLRAALLLASGLFALTAVTRILSPASYTAILVAQVVAAIAQPIVINGITPYGSAYFEEGLRPLAISLSSAAMYAGMIVAMAVGEVVYKAGGLRALAMYSSIITLIASIWTVLMVIKVGALSTPERSHLPTLESIKRIARRREIWIFSGLMGLGLAILDILMSWIEPVLSPLGLGHIAGKAVALMITAGIIGASLLPPIAARYSIRKGLLVTAALSSTVVYGTLALYLNSIEVYILLAVNGFLLMAGLPIMFEWIEITTPLEQQGESIGVIMLTGHIIATIALGLSTPLIGSSTAFFMFLSILGLIAVTLALTLPRR